MNCGCSEWFGGETIEFIDQKDPGPILRIHVSSLPEELSENSGLIYFNDLLWTFNDSGGEAEIYGLQPSNGHIVKTIRLKSAVNVDWEDIAQDDKHVYIGDVGNNNGSRKDLTIYKLSKCNISREVVQELPVSRIEFSYEDQQDFSERYHNHSHDCEALIILEDSIYMFTKDWISENTSVYSLAKTTGKHTAKRITRYEINGLVTGADYHHQKNQLILCGYKDYIPFIHTFNELQIYNLHDSLSKRFSFVHLFGNQTEGISFYEGDTILVSSEKTEYNARLFYLIED